MSTSHSTGASSSQPLLQQASAKSSYGSDGSNGLIAVDPAVFARMIQMRAAEKAEEARRLSQPAIVSPHSVDKGKGGIETSVIILGEGDIPDGDYVGKLRDNKPHGKGKMTYRLNLEKKNLKEYEGEWKNGLFHGKGVLKYRNGAISEGDWREGKLHGRAEVFLANQFHEKYVGEYREGSKEGVGKMTRGNGFMYEGEWKNGSPEGVGVFNSSRGYTYIGEVKDWGPHGNGKKTWLNGDIYEGEWKNAKQDGQGTMMKVNTVMKGVWKNGKLWNGTRGIYNVVEGVLYLENEKISNPRVVYVSRSCCSVQ